MAKTSNPSPAPSDAPAPEPRAQQSDAPAPATLPSPLETGETAETADVVPPGMVRVRHADPSASCSFAGEAYEPDEQGRFTVPQRAVEALSAHGFAPAD